MIRLSNYMQTRIARGLDIPLKEIIEVSVIRMLPYSENTVTLIEKEFKGYDLNAIREIDEAKMEDNEDTLIVCASKLANNDRYLFLIFQPIELYQADEIVRALKFEKD